MSDRIYIFDGPKNLKSFSAKAPCQKNFSIISATKEDVFNRLWLVARQSERSRMRFYEDGYREPAFPPKGDILDIDGWYGPCEIELDAYYIAHEGSVWRSVDIFGVEQRGMLLQNIREPSQLLDPGGVLRGSYVGSLVARIYKASEIVVRVAALSDALKEAVIGTVEKDGWIQLRRSIRVESDYETVMSWLCLGPDCKAWSTMPSEIVGLIWERLFELDAERAQEDKQRVWREGADWTIQRVRDVERGLMAWMGRSYSVHGVRAEHYAGLLDDSIEFSQGIFDRCY